MGFMYFWPERPGLSISALVILGMLVLWAAREPMQQLLRSLGQNLDEGLAAAAKWCKSSAEELRKRARTTLHATGALDLRGKLEREFHRIDAGFGERLKQYSGLHRKLDDTLQKMEGDYQSCGDVPPEVPGWSSAIGTITNMPQTGDPAVAKILERIPARGIPEGFDTPFLLRRGSETHAEPPIALWIRPISSRIVRGLLPRPARRCHCSSVFHNT